MTVNGTAGGDGAVWARANCDVLITGSTLAGNVPTDLETNETSSLTLRNTYIGGHCATGTGNWVTSEGGQRGVLRPQDGGEPVVACDTGAVERAPGDYVHYWADGFESGDTSAWSSTLP